MTETPILFVTRRLPPDVEARPMRDYRAVLNDDDAAWGADDLVNKSRDAGADAILTCGTERFTASVIDKLPDHVKILATFLVGYDHIDVAAAKARNGMGFRALGNLDAWFAGREPNDRVA